MEITSSKEEMIFKYEKDGKASYTIGISRKNQDGSYEKGYIPVRFKKDVVLDDKTKIKIKTAWLDFYKIEKKTIPYIFINEFEKIEAQKPEEEEKPATNWGSVKDIPLTDEELPFYG